ncbi:helix-turn-helix transcriptional regulator [Streptococcus anginosus]|uniref:helix-turn-helix domain-containing protein n=1 Tax=Streptococcus anginosus TaxID=1328 RepID=UPI002FF1868E
MNRLKELRQEKKLSQKELAENIGVHYRTLQNWENGESQIKPDKEERLADFFGVSVGYLLGYDDITKVDVTDVETFKLFEKVADEQTKEFGLKEITDIEQLKELKLDALIALKFIESIRNSLTIGVIKPYSYPWKMEEISNILLDLLTTIERREQELAD